MATTTESALSAEHLSAEQPTEHVDESSRNDGNVANATTALDQNGGERDHIERDVSNILAGLYQEQLASIVAAARASEARNNENGASTSTEHVGTFGEGLPSGLGQAASALTSIAAGFKRTPGNDRTTLGSTTNDDSNGEGKDLGDAPPPPGTEYQAAVEDPQVGINHGGDVDGGKNEELDEETNAAIAAVKSATDTATAAAIASLGSLAAASHLPTSHSSATHSHTQPHHEDPDDSIMDYDSPNGTGSQSPSRNPLKRPRGPELDRQRKDNHKEVERRRRSAINDGITQLSHIVPGCDAKNTNKGAIIHAAVRYIQDLKHNEASNIEKWTLEKLLMDQAMGDLTAQLDEARAQVDRLRAELDDRFADDQQQHHHHGEEDGLQHQQQHHEGAQEVPVGEEGK